MIRQHPQFRDTQIDIIGHSMGCFLLCNAIATCVDVRTTYERCNIVCLAADVEVFSYMASIQKLCGVASTWTHFYCPRDLALKLSETEKNGKKRAGTVDFNVDAVGVEGAIIGTAGRNRPSRVRVGR